MDDFLFYVADRLAAENYAVLVADLFGEAEQRRAWQTAKELMQTNRRDRGVHAAYLSAAVDSIRDRDTIDPSKVAAVGICYGGQARTPLPKSDPPSLHLPSFTRWSF